MASSRAQDLLQANTDDFYAILNVSKDASSEEIKRQYRQLCMTYHPDKHPQRAQDKELYELSATMFAKLQRAYAVLSDPQQRAVYDLYGEAGVEAGHELAPYYNTVAELKAEYEMLQRKAEQERILAMAAPKGKLTLNLDAREYFEDHGDDAYADDYGYGSLFVNPFQYVHVSGMSIEQSIQTIVTDNDTLQLDGYIVSRGAKGGGTLATTWKRQWDKGVSTEVAAGFGDGRFVSLKVQKSLERGSFAIADLQVREVHVRQHTALVAALSAAIYRNLAPHVFGMLQASIGMESAVTTALMYDDQYTAARLEFKMAVEETMVTSSLTYPITDSTKVKLSAQLGLNAYQLGYAIKHQLGESSSLGLSLGCHSSDGVVVKAKFESLRQTYELPIFLSDELLTEAVVYGTLLPLAGYFALQQLVILPWQRAQEHRAKMEQRRRNRALVRKRRQEARAAVTLMKETVERKIEQEASRRGLIIVQAWYGKLTAQAQSASSVEDILDEDDDDDIRTPVIDVTVPLQCMVQDSKLRLHGTSKASLVGFYDPCIDEDKQLRVVYKFQEKMHEVTIDDGDELRMPLRSHCRE